MRVSSRLEPSTTLTTTVPRAATEAPRPAAVQSFTRTGAVTESPQGLRLRAAVVKEQAAQRSEELAKAADESARLANVAASRARQRELSVVDLQSRQAAAALAEANLRKAVAARVAAALARKEAESADPAGTPAAASPTPTPVATGGSSSPVPGAIIGAHFGQRGLWRTYHTGLDFRAGYGTPIKAVRSGVVVFAGNSGDWAGNHVAVRHSDGMTTMYSHMSSMAARVGQTVGAGQVIGYVGQTGRAFGPHLHFELYPAGVRYGDVYKAINPQPWLNAIGVRTR